MDPWTNRDASILRKFLNESDTGKKLILGFKGLEPNMNATNIEGIALQAANFAQYQVDKNFVKNLMKDMPELTEVDRGIPVEQLDVKE